MPVIKSITSILADAGESHTIKAQIQKLDNKVQYMLLWSNISAVWSYLILIFIIIRLYASLNGDHTLLLTSSLGLMYLLLSIYLFVVWRNLGYAGVKSRRASKTYLNYHINKLAGQRRLVSGYLFTNLILLAVSSVFFCLDINNGLTLLLKITTPVNLITYGLGLYFIVNFTMQKRKLELLNNRVDNIAIMEKIRQN